VKPPPFSYRDPGTLDEALDLLAEVGDEASPLAGGQSLVPLLNLRLARPRVVVDLNRIPGLDSIEVRRDRVVVGALARATAVERHNELAEALPVVREALRHVGHPQIRNRTTIGGNLAHADPASELPAVVAALDGAITLASKAGQRTLQWDEFFQGVFTTARRPDELVVGVALPRRPGVVASFVEMTRRAGDFALVGACVSLRREGATVGEARIAVCGAGAAPVRVRQAEASLAGQALDGECLRELKALICEGLDPSGDVHASADYRRNVAATIVCRAAADLWERSAA
jgi:CO/xanthine dehydrogenase FAD-binding subunit